MKRLHLLVLVGVLCVSTIAGAQEGMSEADMMKKWMEVASPKAEHEVLAKSAGEWNCVMTFWMGPNAPAQEAHGTSVDKVINGGRVVESDFTGEMMGMPYEGHGHTGYDNFNKTYWSTWTDNMTTGMMFMEGTSTDGGKTIVFNTTMDEPVMDVKDKPVRFVSKWISDDEHVLESWDEIGTPQEFKAFQIVYTRKK
ncbi:MAG: DUF1579 domain-containing protein [bacterium]|nr:DUF1579 domain-containing protein [bacterium]